ncbi:RsiV family protein [Paenalcaligenes niemegkensis]|uniref:RsiV family protein n=1 Tax=Paenalcaligenes niemegkensis TaxID=2895469 RepID=UPI001EE7A8AB|nr:RsiV family protein [Paenalcaligenes niemegkensis]MCQ9616309.1 RsiV family protein [Paenalcaligenes niemegkensis]
MGKNQGRLQGECPKLSVDSLVFPGNAKLSLFVDATLASMTGMGDGPLHSSIDEFENYYWRTAGPRDEVILAAKTRYRNKDLTVVELGSWQYFTGAAHGMAATQFINWDNQRGAVLHFGDIIAPGKTQDFLRVLQQAHQQWLLTQEDAQENIAQYNRLWPFQPTENIALTDTGVVAKYDAYAIAPYSSGQPELTVPYSQLKGILNPAYLQR